MATTPAYSSDDAFGWGDRVYSGRGRATDWPAAGLVENSDKAGRGLCRGYSLAPEG